MPVLIAAVALLGLAVGSVLSVIGSDAPVGASLSRAARHCPSCDQPIRNRRSVFVVSWLRGRGRGAGCWDRLGAHALLLILTTVLLFVSVTLRLSARNQLPALPAYLYFVAIGVALARIDIDCKRLPNVIVLPSYPVVLGLLSAAALWQQDWSALLRVLVGTVGLFGFYLILAMVHPGGMGFGDVKLAGIVGAVLAYSSYTALLVGGMAAFVLAAGFGALLIVGQRGSAKQAIPFGPFMIAGSLISIFAAELILGFYLKNVPGG